MEKKKFINVHIKIREEDYDIAIGLISQLSILGIQECNDELIVSFNYDKFDNAIRNTINKILNDINKNSKIIKEEIIEEKNWNEEWEANIEPIKIGDNIVITPLWKANEINSKIKIIINPKMAFGTGSHATTKLMCLLLEKTVSKGSNWIDIGTGTSILSILAVKLGADKVLAIDNDHWSIENAKENLVLNNADNNVELIQADIKDFNLPMAHGICANLSIALIQKCWQKFYYSLINKSGDLLISGILIYDRDEVLINARKNRFELVGYLQEDEWLALHFKIKEN
ncbi:MAG: 50S ribosomal protein L11 methyltransferase [Candidatus Woesearchaeota archaeon]